MSDEEVLFEVEDRIAIIRLNRPTSLNALNANMREKLDNIFQEVEKRDDIRVLTIFGEGRAFCTGQDLKEGPMKYEPVQYIQKKSEIDFQRRLELLSKPSIVGLQGYAIGRGLEFALTCDIRIAAENTQFSLPEVKLGMLPGSGGTQRLARIIGQARSMHMVLTGERIDSNQALLWGLVTNVVPLDDLRSTVMETARSIANSAPFAVTFARQAIRQSFNMSLHDGLQMESALQAALMISEDRAEGIKAFREGRKPNFTGR